MDTHKYLEFTANLNMADGLKIAKGFGEDGNGNPEDADLVIDGDSKTVFVPGISFYTYANGK